MERLKWANELLPKKGGNSKIVAVFESEFDQVKDTWWPPGQSESTKQLQASGIHERWLMGGRS